MSLGDCRKILKKDEIYTCGECGEETTPETKYVIYNDKDLPMCYKCSSAEFYLWRLENMWSREDWDLKIKEIEKENK
jgi:hypothetical protein